VVKSAADEIQLGPESMGSFPGPVCYGLGGDKPTLTDAFVTAGLIDPEYFLGGTKHLDLDQAREAVDASVARPRGLSIQEACRAIIGRAYDMVAGMIRSASQELRQDLSKHVLFAYGGNGGLFACGVAERAGLEEVYLFGLGPLFSAFGSSVADISHVYERSFHMAIGNGPDVGPLNRLIGEMREAGIRDLLGEGINPDDAECSVELELSQPGGSSVYVKCQTQQFASLDDLRRQFGRDMPKGDVSLELVRMRVKKAISKPALVPQALGTDDPASALLGMREVAYGSSEGMANLYKWESLAPGNMIQGCSILEAENSTYLVPEGWMLKIDQHGNAQVKSGARTSASANLQETRTYGKRP
jgi:N-methylhydantoinase A/oxoprolinase/acetone carboxylase beta subunit